MRSSVHLRLATNVWQDQDFEHQHTHHTKSSHSKWVKEKKDEREVSILSQQIPRPLLAMLYPNAHGQSTAMLGCMRLLPKNMALHNKLRPLGTATARLPDALQLV